MASKGLCNGTRMIVRELKDNVIICEILTGDSKGQIVFIPRITIEVSDRSLGPMKFTRHQFPLKLAFGMTINKAQGQTFGFVGLYMENEVFCHGQLYVGMSRVRKMCDLKVQLNPKKDSNTLKNIVYPELLED